MTIEEVEKYVFPYDGFYEVLLSSSGKTDNISPMGVLRKGGALYLRVYSETTTFQNLLVYPFCATLITHDAEMFYRSLMGEVKGDSKVYGLPMIGGKTAIFFRASLDSQDEPSVFRITPFDYIGNPLIAFSRGEALFIDLLIHFTRVRILKGKDLERILTVMKYEVETINRVSPRLRVLTQKIMEGVNSFTGL